MTRGRRFPDPPDLTQKETSRLVRAPVRQSRNRRRHASESRSLATAAYRNLRAAACQDAASPTQRDEATKRLRDQLRAPNISQRQRCSDRSGTPECLGVRESRNRNGFCMSLGTHPTLLSVAEFVLRQVKFACAFVRKALA
jgi:hypothetical protein